LVINKKNYKNDILVKKSTFWSKIKSLINKNGGDILIKKNYKKLTLKVKIVIKKIFAKNDEKVPKL